MRSLLGGLHLTDVTSSSGALLGDGDRLVSPGGATREVDVLVDELLFSRRTRTGGLDLSSDDSIAVSVVARTQSTMVRQY